MTITTKQDRCDSVIDRSQDQHKTKYSQSLYPHILPSLIHLQQAGNLTEETIAEVIGNRTWTKLQCSFCDNDDAHIVVNIDMEEYDENYTLCDKCITKIKDMTQNI